MKRNVLVLLFLAALVAIVAHPGLNGAFILDDTGRIVDNPDIKDIGQLWGKLIYPYDNPEVPSQIRNDPSRPIIYITYGLNYYFSQLNTFGWHVVDLCLHTLLAFILFQLSLLLIGRFFKINGFWPALITAAAFAVHPISIMVALYPYARSDTVFSLFVALAMMCHLRFENQQAPRAALVYLCFVLGLASKQTTFVLPALLLALDWTLIGRRSLKDLWPSCWYHLGMAAIMASYVLTRILYFGHIGDVSAEQESLWRNSEYASVQPWIVLRYLQMYFVPAGMCFDHGIYQAVFRPDTLVTLTQKLFSYAAWMAILGWIVYLLRRRTPMSSFLLFAFAFFGILLAPTSSIMPTSDAMVDRRAYLGGFAVLLVIAVFFEIARGNLAIQLPVLSNEARRFGRWLLVKADGIWGPGSRPAPAKGKGKGKGKSSRKAEARITIPATVYGDGTVSALQRRSLIVAGLAWFVFAALTSHHWSTSTKTEESMWREVLKSYPKNERALYSLGRILGDDPARELEAKETYDRLFTLYPGHFKGYHNNAVLYARKGDFDTAEKFLKHALALRPQHEPTRRALERIAEIKRTMPQSGAPAAGTAATTTTPAPASGQQVVSDDVLLQNKEQVYKLYVDAIAKDPQNLAVRRNFLRFLKLAGRTDDIKAQIQQIQQTFQNNDEAKELVKDAQTP